MKEQISKLYCIYGKYINKFRAFPLVLDGLKIVERRILYSLFERAKDHFVKSAEIVGWVIGQYHPHGDQSAYGSLVALVNGDLAVGQGNWGTSTGIVSCDPAAMRYTEVKSSKLVLDMAFEFIKYVPKEELELKAEPIFLPTKLPICLLNKNYCQGIGFGSRTVIPSYSMGDLVKRLRWLLAYDKKEPIIRPLTDCIYLSKDKDFQNLLTTGKAKLEYRGISEVDYGSKSVIIRSTPPNKSLSKILKRFELDIQVQKSVGFIDESTTTTKVRFTPIKRTMKLERLKRKINSNLTGSLTFECNMCDLDGNVILVSIDQMLLNVYNNYKNVAAVVLKSNIEKLQNEIDEMNLIARIKVVLPKWLKSYPDDSEKVIEGIYQDTKILKAKIKELFEKYTLIKILKIKTDIKSLEQKKTQFQTNYSNLENYVWNEKYATLKI